MCMKIHTDLSETKHSRVLQPLLRGDAEMKTNPLDASVEMVSPQTGWGILRVISEEEPRGVVTRTGANTWIGSERMHSQIMVHDVKRTEIWMNSGDTYCLSQWCCCTG